MGEFCEFEIDFEQFDDLRSVVVHDECGAHDDVWFYRLDGLKAENAKLRELLKDMWASMADCHDICATCKHFKDEYEAADGLFGHTGECVFLRRMHELGVEVIS